MRIPANRLTAGLAVVGLWVLLFGELSVANVAGGVLVAALVVGLFPRARVTARHRIVFWRVGMLVGYLAGQLVVSSVKVARAVISPTPARVRGAVVRVPLRTESELVATIVADLISLTPGTLTLDVHHDPARLFVHALGVGDPIAVVESVQRLEARVLRAVQPRFTVEETR